MAGNIGRAIRSKIVAWGGVGEAVYRDQAPEDAEHPFVTFNEELTDNAALRGDGASPIARRRLAQVDLWMTRDGEDDTLRPGLIDALDGVRLTDDEWFVLRATVQDSQRMVETAEGIVHIAITLRATYL